MGSSDYAEALEFLYGLHRFGLRPGLETTRRMAAWSGNPHQSLRFIHVAGTNGKGSTCAFLESVYRRAGYRVGLYTSPHLVSFRERIRLNGEPIPEADVVSFMRASRAWTAVLEEEEQPTFFEWVTVLAMHWFRERGCDLVVWETGMGGRLDATNIVQPQAALITNVGWDHMQWLGNTLAAIATEKAGILKPGVPALTAAQDAEVLEVLRARARACGVLLGEIREDGALMREVRGWRLGLRGAHQAWNAALAVSAVRVLAPVFPVSDACLREAVESARWPGRFDVRKREGRTIVLDGAHNRPAFEVLASALKSEFPGVGYTLVVGMLADKELDSLVEHLLWGAERVVVVPIHASRGGDPGDLARRCERVMEAGRVTRAESVAEAWGLVGDGGGAGGSGLVVITGSLYLVGEALEMLEGERSSERGLNDWSPRR